MNLRIAPRQVVALVLFAVVGVVLLLVMTARFGGPSLRVGEPFALRADVRDSEGLSVRSDVLYRGVRVGRVAGISRRGGVARVRLVLTDDAAVPRRGAWVSVGSKTLLGEAYVDLHAGARGAARLPSGARVPARASVEIDEALGALGAPARADLRALLGEAGTGAVDPATAGRVSDTIAELRRTVGELHALEGTLDGQEDDLAQTVRGGRVVVGALAEHEDALRALTRGGERTLSALTRRDGALHATTAELPRLLTTARATLTAARPLVREARPAVADLRAAAPPLAGALDAVPPAARDLRVVLARAATLRRAAVPVLARARPVLAAAAPVARRLGPAMRNVVTMARYFEPRKNTIAAWFSNTASLGDNGDAKGKWARFFIFADPATATGGRTTLGENAYTRPDDAAHNAPYRPGDYPRLTAAPIP